MKSVVYKKEEMPENFFEKSFPDGLDIGGKIGYNNSSNRNVVRKHVFSVRTDVNLIVVAVL